MRIGIALGSNLGDRMASLRAARTALVDLTTDKRSFLVSPVYETDPVGCEPGAGKFLNAVLEMEYDGDPTDLLDKIMRVEELLGRERDHSCPPSPGSGVVDVSRKIDIDLLYADDLVIQNERLQLPHPRLHLRKFVLQPLVDIRPDLILANQTKPVRELLAQLQDSTKVSCLAKGW